jgi:transcriptional regulator with XRE-family HTH domain
MGQKYLRKLVDNIAFDNYSCSVTNMAMNTALKMAILTSGLTQTDVAKKTGIHESRLSRIIRGHYEPNDVEKRLIAKSLRIAADQLFAQETSA